ncbi:MAG: helix-turn-helix domain-containing protein [Desulfobacterales bacterium]
MVTVRHGAFAIVTMATPQKSLQAMEMGHIIRVLEQTNWRIDGPKGAAVILDMNPSTLRSRMRKLGIKNLKGVQTFKGSAFRCSGF